MYKVGEDQLPCVTFPNLLHIPIPQRQELVLRIYLEDAGECNYSCTPTKGQPSSTNVDDTCCKQIALTCNEVNTS